MIPQFGFAEILVIAMLALIVVGPKDLPHMARKAGQMFARIKAMGQEFKDAFNQMGEDEDLAALKKEIEELKALGKLSNLSDENLSNEMREMNETIGQELKPDPPQTKGETKSTPPKPDSGAADDS